MYIHPDDEKYDLDEKSIFWIKLGLIITLIIVIVLNLFRFGSFMEEKNSSNPETDKQQYYQNVAT